MSASRFDHRVAVVTGAASGLWRATALRLGAEGRVVAALDIAAKGAEETAAQPQTPGTSASRAPPNRRLRAKRQYLRPRRFAPWMAIIEYVSDAPLRLRPFREPDLELLTRLATDPAFSAPFEWFGFKWSPEGLRRRWEEDGFLSKDPHYLAVAHVDELAIGGVILGKITMTTRAPRLCQNSASVRS